MEDHTCLTCNRLLNGRIDKKFCDDQCRSQFNNRNKRRSGAMKHIDQILKKNRQVLMELTPGETPPRVQKRKLFEQGYNFSYHTHTNRSKSGSTLIFCYDYGFRVLKKDLIVILKAKENAHGH